MTGETFIVDTGAPQPGGRPPAPGALALVQAFVNTHYDLTAERGGERFVDPTALRSWLVARGLLEERARLDGEDLRRALAVREGLRSLAFANNDQPLDEAAVDALRRASAGAGVEVRMRRRALRQDARRRRAARGPAISWARARSHTVGELAQPVAGGVGAAEAWRSAAPRFSPVKRCLRARLALVWTRLQLLRNVAERA